MSLDVSGKLGEAQYSAGTAWRGARLEHLTSNSSVSGPTTAWWSSC